MNHERASDDRVRPAQRNLRVLDDEVAPARGGLDVAEVARVSRRVRRRAVIHLVRVKVRSRGHAPVRRIAELVNVQAVLARRESGDGADDLRRRVAALAQLEHARHPRGAREHAHRLLLLRRHRDRARAMRGRLRRPAIARAGVRARVSRRVRRGFRFVASSRVVAQRVARAHRAHAHLAPQRWVLEASVADRESVCMARRRASCVGDDVARARTRPRRHHSGAFIYVYFVEIYFIFGNMSYGYCVCGYNW